MKIQMTSPKGMQYLIKPFSNGLCWEVFIQNENYGKPKRRGKNEGEVDTAEWKSLGLYPNNIHHAIDLMVQRMLMNPDERSEIKVSEKKIDKALNAIKESIEVYLNKITVEVTK